MPRGLIRGDFYNEFLVFENNKLTYFLENISQRKIEKEINLECSLKDIETLERYALDSNTIPKIKQTDVTLAYAKILFANNEEKTSFVEDETFWKIAKGYLPKK